MNAPTSRSRAEQVIFARRALALVDLTELDDAATEDDVDALCARASTPNGTVAAVCVWPRFVARCTNALGATGVRVATVVNFPSGDEPVDQIVTDIRVALNDGADEIDAVLPHRAFASGDTNGSAALLDAVRAAVPQDGRHLLKVILETGELRDLALVRAASRLAIDHGADFIKTSTGKSRSSASLHATEVMLDVIRDTSRCVGLKPSGGIRTLDDAAAYLDQADTMMGPDWATPRTFRFGASGLLTAFVEAIQDTGTGNDAPGTEY